MLAMIRELSLPEQLADKVMGTVSIFSYACLLFCAILIVYNAKFRPEENMFDFITKHFLVIVFGILSFSCIVG